jgi:DNA-binding transcriptional regulator/RsmH inhibitor MraZ
MTQLTEKDLEGCWHRVIDAHGRLRLPSEVRGEFLDGVVLSPSPTTADCVAIWPTKRFEAFVASVSKTSPDGHAADLFSGASQAGKPDRDGRVAVPAFLLEHAGLSDTSAIVLGVGDHLELWDERHAPNLATTEPFVTRAVAGICDRDGRFCLDLTRVLLTGAASRSDGKRREIANELLRRLPRKRLKLVAEQSVFHDGLIDAWRDDWESRIDWVFSGDSFALAVEVKTRISTPFGERQLERDYRALKDRHGEIHRPHWGLLALLPESRELIGSWRRPRFLGALIWSEIMPELRALTPADEHDAKLWSKLLDSVSTAAGRGQQAS